MSRRAPFLWREVIVQRPLTETDATTRIRRLADDPSHPRVALELRSEGGNVRMLLGADADRLPHIMASLDAIAGETATRAEVQVARSLQVAPSRRAFAPDDLAVSVPEIYRAISRTVAGEVLVLQLVLGPRIRSRTVSSQTGELAVASSFFGKRQPPERLVNEQVRQKHHEPGFAATVRIGVAAEDRNRQRSLLLGLHQALRRMEAPGVHLSLRSTSATALNEALSPWGWPLHLSVREAAALSGLPTGEELAGLLPLHPKLLRPLGGAPDASRHVVVAEAIAPGFSQPLTLSEEAILKGVHLLGPIGSGKSDAAAQLVVQWINQGNAAIIVEPKRDLSDAVATRVDEQYRDRIAYLDLFSEEGIIGFNPLRLNGQPPELVVDSLVHIFATVLSDVIGVTTRDLLNAALLSLVQYPGATLLMLPLLLADSKFRHKVVANVAGDIFLQHYWAEFEGKSESARANLVAPVLTRLRAILLRESFRRCLGQAEPAFDIASVFGPEKRILIVPLPEAQLGKAGVALLGSLVLHEVFAAVRSRAVVEPSKRHPVMVVVDEWHRFVRGNEEFAEALTLFRGYGAGFVLCNQVLGQLSKELRDVVTGTIRSHVYFQLGYDDAALIARHSADLEAIDLMSLGKFHIYAALYGHGKTQPFVSGRTIQLPPPPSEPAIVREQSSRRYGTPTEVIEAELRRLYGDEQARGDEQQPPPEIGRRYRTDNVKGDPQP
ncbi:hypothetical protein ABCS02_14075 [Microbacterium sp. X-17]|uniref:type IV secretory system conjugative DNA transfer family protein n=1 Tax=Microbacterium sp. X-17 TaxID=3144404 RepID=UPI0031F4834C